MPEDSGTADALPLIQLHAGTDSSLLYKQVVTVPEDCGTADALRAVAPRISSNLFVVVRRCCLGWKPRVYQGREIAGPWLYAMCNTTKNAFLALRISSQQPPVSCLTT